jgi:hypothetical protein
VQKVLFGVHAEWNASCTAGPLARDGVRDGKVYHTFGKCKFEGAGKGCGGNVLDGWVERYGLRIQLELFATFVGELMRLYF